MTPIDFNRSHAAKNPHCLESCLLKSEYEKLIQDKWAILKDLAWKYYELCQQRIWPDSCIITPDTFFHFISYLCLLQH